MTTIFTLIVLFFSVVIHEIAHGSVANFLGDPTAKNEGRLTLNPIKHLDLFGSILLPIFLLIVTFGQGPIFGWAKPVPVNPFNFRDQKWGGLKVAIAGPATNFIIALIFGLLIRFIKMPDSLFIFFSIITIYNFMWGLFNLLPLPPLDGSWILFSIFPEKLSGFKIFLQQYGMVILILFIFFGTQWLFLAANFFYGLTTGVPFNF